MIRVSDLPIDELAAFVAAAMPMLTERIDDQPTGDLPVR
jgi:hypothetical protein